MCKICRSRKIMHLLANSGLDTDEDEPSEVSQKRGGPNWHCHGAYGFRIGSDRIASEENQDVHSCIQSSDTSGRNAGLLVMSISSRNSTVLCDDFSSVVSPRQRTFSARIALREVSARGYPTDAPYAAATGLRRASRLQTRPDNS